MSATHPSPIYSLNVDGEDITHAVADRLSSLTLTDNRGFEADQVDIVLDDSDGKLALPSKGAKLRMSMGWKETGLIDKGSYVIDDISWDGEPDIITVRARSADLRSGLTTQHERSFHGKTVGDIVRTIASENDLEPLVSAALDVMVIDHIDQTNESSANLLTRMAGMFDAVATVKNGKLIFIHAGSGFSASGKKLPTITITRQDGDKPHFNISDRGSFTMVKAVWHDIGAAKKGEVFWGEKEDTAENSNKKSSKPAEPTVTGALKSLGSTFKSRSAALRAARKEWSAIKKSSTQRARYVGVKAHYNDVNLKVTGDISYGEANEQAARSSASKMAARDAVAIASLTPQNAFEASADNVKVLRHVYASLESAQRAARTQWRRLQRGMAEFNIALALGRPEIIPEITVIVQGFKRDIDSTDWIVTRAVHSLSNGGLTTKLEFEIKATELPG